MTNHDKELFFWLVIMLPLGVGLVLSWIDEKRGGRG
jgi:hypothetical protein